MKPGPKPGSKRTDNTVRFSVRLTPSQLEALKAKGGADWVRSQLPCDFDEVGNPCSVCGSVTTPLHTSGVCGNCWMPVDSAPRDRSIQGEESDWASRQFESVKPNQADVRAFDDSADGQRYREITGMTMWENLGGDTLPATDEVLS